MIVLSHGRYADFKFRCAVIIIVQSLHAIRIVFQRKRKVAMLRVRHADGAKVVCRWVATGICGQSSHQLITSRIVCRHHVQQADAGCAAHKAVGQRITMVHIARRYATRYGG